MRSPIVAALLLVVGGILGAGIAVLLQPAASRAPPPPPGASVPLPEVAAPVEKPAAPDAGAPPAPVSKGAAPLEDLGVRAEEWVFLRGALVRERERLEGNRMDPALGGLEVLRRVKESGVDPLSVIGSYDAVRARVRVAGKSQAIEAPADGSPVNLAELARDAVIVEFGPGTFKFDPNSREWLSVREGARSLEIRGAGMDRTVLSVERSDFLFAWEDAVFENLVVRDLTLDGGERGLQLLDARGGVSAAFENIRVRGWSGGGHSAPIGVSGSVLFGARGCEFLGRENGGMFVLSVRGPSLAVFEKCLFRDVGEAVVSGGSGEAGSAVRLVDCTYENSAVASRRMQRRKGVNSIPVAVRGGTVALGPPDLPDEERRALWGAPFLASLEGVTFGPGRPVCTLGELATVAERVSVAPTETVFGARYLGPVGDGPARFGIRVLDRANSAVRWRVVGADGADLEKAPRNPGGGWNPPTAAALEKFTLAAAIRSSEIPSTAAAVEAQLSAAGSGDQETTHLYVNPGTAGFPTWFADAATGKVLGGPRTR